MAVINFWVRAVIGFLSFMVFILIFFDAVEKNDPKIAFYGLIIAIGIMLFGFLLELFLHLWGLKNEQG